MRTKLSNPEIVDLILDRTFYNGEVYRPTRQSLVDEFGVSQATAKWLFKQARLKAADRHGAFFGYHRKHGGFRYCPTGNVDIYREMRSELFLHWRSEGDTVPAQLRGAMQQGFLTEDEFEMDRKQVHETRRNLEMLAVA